MRSPLNRDGLGVRLPLVHSVNISVYENEVDILAPRACAMIEKQVLKQRGNCSEKEALSH